MPWTLYRYVMADLLRIVGLTTGVLVTVIAFGATIKPLTGDSLLDAGQTLRYLALAIVPMLQYALPFAAGFGATLTLHRMASDNEIQAMAVSGISYRRILAPVAGMGLVLTLIMVLLTQWIIPRFWSVIEHMLATDVTKVFAAHIRRGEAFERGNLQIYAEDIIPQQSPEGTQGPQTRLFLLKVAAATLDDSGRIVADVTAAKAAADVYRRADRTIIKLIMKDATAFDPSSGLGSAERFEHTLVLPGPMRDNPKAMTQGQLLAIRRNPDTFAQIIEARMALAKAIGEYEARASIDDRSRAQGKIELMAKPADGTQERTSYVVTAAKMKDGELSAARGGPIEVTQLEGSDAVRRFTATAARLVPAGSDTGDAPSFDLVLESYQVADLRRQGSANTLAELTIPGLVPAGWVIERLVDMPSPDLMRRAEPLKGGAINDGIDNLRDEIVETQHEIVSHLLNRYALSVMAFLLLMLGATIAMWRRHSLPLSVYIWAFVPAIADLILASAGQQMLRDGHMIGHALMWSGNGLIAAVLAFAYFKLSRH